MPFWVSFGLLKFGFLTNEIRNTSYELRVNIYWMNYELLFKYDLRVTIYCASYNFPYTSCKLLLIARATSSFLRKSYQLLFIARFMSKVLRTSYELLFVSQVAIVDCAKFLYYISYSLLWPFLYKIKYP